VAERKVKWGALLCDLNWIAGWGHWIRPDGMDTFAILATERYEGCGSKKVHGKSRSGISDNSK
jgi:hypothetical protein